MLTLAAARPAWGAEDSNGDSHLCLERGSEMRMVLWHLRLEKDGLLWSRN